MKVRDLIAQLQTFDDEDEVHFAYCYGDYGRTTVAPAITKVDTGNVVHSDYHRMPRLIDEDESDRRTDDEDATEVVILS